MKDIRKETFVWHALWPYNFGVALRGVLLKGGLDWKTEWKMEKKMDYLKT